MAKIYKDDDKYYVIKFGKKCPIKHLKSVAYDSEGNAIKWKITYKVFGLVLYGGVYDEIGENK